MSWSHVSSSNSAGATDNPYKWGCGADTGMAVFLTVLTVGSPRTGGSPTITGNTTSVSMIQANSTLNRLNYYLEFWYCLNLPYDTSRFFNIPNTGSIQLNLISQLYSSTYSQTYISDTGTTNLSTNSSLSLSCSNNNILFVDSIVIQNPYTLNNKTIISSELLIPPYNYSQYSIGETIGTTTFTWDFPSSNWMSILSSVQENVIQGNRPIYFDTTTKYIVQTKYTNLIEYQL